MLIKELLAELESGTRSLDDILRTQRPQGERTALMRCAVPLTFDETLARQVLLAGTDLTFTDLIAHRDIEALPRTSHYRVTAGSRSAHWKEWWTADPGVDSTAVPAELAELLRRLAGLAAEQGQVLEQLAATVLVDPAAAVELFTAAYGRADAKADLVACQDLIDVLSDPDRQSLLTPAVRELRTVQQSYLQARQRFSTEWFSSARYLEPSGVEHRYFELLSPGGPRTMNLYARGGRGKTMQLRWLVSRRLVPDASVGGLAGGRIPCALVDFDFVDPVNATRDPWLLLTEIAGQLDTQLATPLFGNLLDQIGWAAPLLRQQAATDVRVASAGVRLREQSPDTPARVVRRFREILAGRPADQPILLIFDTIEEIHLRPEGDLRALVAMLDELLTGIPAVRIILSGRYPIREILGDVADLLPGMQAVEVRSFTARMAHRYLSGRGIPSGPVRDAVAEKADGDPFLLSLLADVVQVQPALSPAEIRRYPADVVYLINRVVRRIPERGVRWLLRYGVVPRRLTLPFVQDVMAGPLTEAMAGRSEDDTPDTDDLPSERPDDPTFPAGPEPAAAPSLPDLWDQLRRYAGTTSWVVEDPAAPGALQFRPEVVTPMRGILRRHPIFQLLHTRAIDYYEHRAAADPDRWADWTREAVYHRFQRDGAAAAGYWQAAVARSDSDPVRQEGLANEVLGPDYLDRSEPVTGGTGEPVVSNATIAQAHLIRSLALVRQARSRRVPAGDRLWSEAARSLQVALDAAARDPSIALSAGTIGYLRAAFALRDHDPALARRLLTEALDGIGGGPERARLLLLLGDIDVELGSSDATEHFRAALAESTDPDQQLAILTRIMLADAARDAYAEALEACNRALDATPEPTKRSDLLNFRAIIDLNCGNTTGAEADLTSAVKLTRDVWVAKLVEVALARRNPKRAFLLLTTTPAGNPSAPTAELAEIAEANGRAAAAVLDRVAAASALQSARRTWREIGDAEGTARCVALLVALEMREIGNLTLAARHLEDADISATAAPENYWLTNRLLHAELLSRRGDTDGAAADLTQTLGRVRSAATRPGLLVRAILGGLAFGPAADHDALLAELTGVLPAITPVAARIQALGSLAASRVSAPNPLGWDRVRSVLADPAAPADAVDAANRHLILAEIDQLAGDAAGSRRRMMAARDAFAAAPTTFWMRSWCRAADRLVPDHSVPVFPDLQRFADDWADHPLLVEAFLVERAEAMLAAGHQPAVQPALDLAEAAERRLDGEPTQWQVRRLETQATSLELAADGEVKGPARSRIEKCRGTARRTASVLGLPARSPVTVRQNALDPLRTNRVRVSLRATDGGVTVTADSAPPRPGGPADDRIETPDARESGMAFIEGAASWWRGQLDGGRPPDQLLPQTGSLLAASVGPLQARIEGPIAQLHAFPWEQLLGGFADVLHIRATDAAEHDEIAFVQTALQALGRMELAVDSDFGAVSRAALTAYQGDVGLPANGMITESVLDRLQHDPATRPSDKGPSVLIVQQNAPDQMSSNISSSNFGTDLPSLYERVGFRVRQHQPTGTSGLVGAVMSMIKSGDVPTVLHLAGGIRDAGDGLKLTFGSGFWAHEAYSGSELDDYGAPILDSLVRLFPTGPAPLVVLDIDAPYSPSELAIQLFQRNTFAADLFALGRTPAILATGLVGSLDTTGSTFGSTPTVDRLILGLADGHSLLQIARDIRDVERTQSGRPPTALFTHLPWLRPVIR